MSQPSAEFSPAPGAPRERRSASVSPALASAILGSAAVLGIVGDSLLSEGIIGLGLPVWVALVVLSLVALAWRADLVIPRESAVWLALAVLCAAGVAWRDSETLQFFNVCAAMGALAFGAAALNHAGSVLFARRLRETVSVLFTVAISTLGGIWLLLDRESSVRAAADTLGTRFSRYLRAAIITAVVLAIFIPLLVSADPIFASLVSIPAIDFGTVMRHLIVVAVLTAIVGGWSRAALIPKQSDVNAAPARFLRLTPLEVTAALTALNILFAAYVLAQLGWFFGGEEFLRERTGLTAAEYARGGFFQMVVVVALVVPMLVGSRVALEPDRAIARRHSLLSLPLIGLLGAMIGSAASRMQLYVQYYGLSIERVYAIAVMAWLTVVLLWLTVTVLRSYSRPFIGGAAISALATLATLNVIAPDRIVARVNIERAARTATTDTPLDLTYLSWLSGEALDLTVAAVLAEPKLEGAKTPAAIITSRCDAARNLLRRWGPLSERKVDRDVHAAWRSWNAGQARGLRAVGARSAELWRVVHACPAVPPKSSQSTPASSQPTPATPQR